MTTGTNHFTDRESARQYFRAYGFNAADVDRKIELKEIEIGQPDKKPGHTMGIDSDGRYFYKEIPTDPFK